MLRLTIRATDDTVPSVLIKLMEERLAAGMSTQPEQHERLTGNVISDTFSNVMVTAEGS